MLKIRSGKVLQKPQQKEKNRQEITETKTFKVSKAPKTRQPEAATDQQSTTHRRQKQ